MSEVTIMPEYLKRIVDEELKDGGALAQDYK